MLRRTHTGCITFYAYGRVAGKRAPVRANLGRYPGRTIEQARKRARKTRVQMADGANPITLKRAAKVEGVTLGEVLDAYIGSRDLKSSTVSDYRRAMRESCADWLNKPVVSITGNMVERRNELRGQRSKARTSNAMRVLRALLNYASAKYEDADGNPLIKKNPVKRLSDTRTWHRVSRRRTVIKNHQLAAWFTAVMGLQPERNSARADVARAYLLTVLFTGLRKEEAAQLKWSDIDFKDRTFTIDNPKNRDDHTLPLPDFLHDMLAATREQAESEYVFPGIGGTKTGADMRHWIEKVSAASDVQFTIHDLRRTFITTAESLDISMHALKRLLNHRISQNDVTAGYIITDVARLREPMRKIENHLLRAGSLQQTATVVELSQRRP